MTERLSLPVIWGNGTGEATGVGRLGLSVDGLRLEGRVDGVVVREEIPLDQVRGARLVEAPVERLRGRPTLIIDCIRRPALRVAVVFGGFGLLMELADQLRDLVP